MELPKNKPAVNGKYKTVNAIKSAIYKILEANKVEGRYADESWQGIQKLLYTLHENGIGTELLEAVYEGHGQVEGSSLPTKKVYKYQFTVRDKEGKNVELYFKVTCAFIGKTGTMADKQYELTYYFL